MNFELILFFHLNFCVFLTGLIWMVQLVHYPSFYWISDLNFPKFHTHHSQSITWIVGPLMCIELLTALGLAFLRPELIWLFNLGLVAAIWLTTAFLSVPIHQKLSQIPNRNEIRRLILTNWPRTLLWSLRSVLLCYLFLNH